MRYLKSILVYASCVACAATSVSSFADPFGYSQPTTTINADTTKISADLLSANVGYIDVNQIPHREGDEVSPIRRQALQQTASSLGAQGALAWRADHLNVALEHQTTDLDRIFNFRMLLINNNVLPPVLSESSGSLHLDSDHALRLAEHTFRIVNNARFVTAPPTWREYLLLNFRRPDPPDRSILPRNFTETQIWNDCLVTGWNQGVQQANDIFSANLHRLKRDFEGMILYRKLLAQNMVTAPYVAQADLGVTGDENQIRINDQVLRITAISKLRTNSSEWTPVLSQAPATAQEMLGEHDSQ